MKREWDPDRPELMDRPQPVTPALERDLANLRSLNRWFGGHRLVRHFLRTWLQPNTAARVLDVATGSGDTPRLIVDHARREGVRVEVTAIDQQQATVAIARRLSADYPEITYKTANILDWDPAEPYDLVLCSLALHHFSDENGVRLLKKCAALSSSAVLVADLRRARSLSIGVHCVTAIIYRDSMTKIDGRLSAARAFSFDEVRALAQRAGWRNFGHARFPVGRQAIWMPE